MPTLLAIYVNKHKQIVCYEIIFRFSLFKLSVCFLPSVYMSLLRRLKSFYEEGEREIMNEQIIVLENKVREKFRFSNSHLKFSFYPSSVLILFVTLCSY